MTTHHHPNRPHQDDSHRGTRVQLLLLTLGFIAAAVLGVVYLSYQHPRLAVPLGTGGAVAAVLVPQAIAGYKGR
ncbi:hypothetical protein [Streptomyces decoyicus]